MVPGGKDIATLFVLLKDLKVGWQGALTVLPLGLLQVVSLKLARICDELAGADVVHGRHCLHTHLVGVGMQTWLA